MGNLTRKQQKVFAQNAINNGQFGSLQDTTKVLSSDITVLQANAAYEEGWDDGAISGEELPALEEFQGLNYVNTSQIAYLLNKGIPEWEIATEYFIGDIQREVTGTKLYRSEVDNNIGLDIAAIAYNAGTTYEINDVAMDTNGDIYRSLAAGNIGNPLTDVAKWELAWILLGDLGDLINFGIASESTKGVSFLPKQITISNGTDTDHDIDFTAGNFQFDDGSGQAVASALTKQIDATWAAGDAAGGLFAGSVAADTWYHCFEISDASGSLVDAGFDTSVTAANIPSGYTKYKRVGSVLTDPSSNIVGFIQYGNYFSFKTPILDITSAASGFTTGTLNPISTPLGVKVLALVGVSITGSPADNTVYLSSPEQDNVAADATNGALTSFNSENNGSDEDQGGVGFLPPLTDASSQIRIRTSGSNGTLNLGTQGWIDNNL